MISAKLAVLMATMAVIGAGALPMAPMAAATVIGDPRGDQEAGVEIERNNEIEQTIEQSNEACTNTVVAAEGGEGDQSVDSDQSNKCFVVQSNEAEQDAEIEDESENFLFNLAAFSFGEEE